MLHLIQIYVWLYILEYVNGPNCKNNGLKYACWKVTWAIGMDQTIDWAVFVKNKSVKI